MLSDQDIKKLLNNNIVIFPFDEKDLTPIGYNLNPSDFVYSLQKRDLAQEMNEYYIIEPHDTVLILTKEAVWVSKKYAGTFHSKVGIVSDGFSHISTTLDPNWKGPLLISLNNPTNLELKLYKNKSFITLIFYEMKTRSLKDHDNLPSRTDILKKISTEVLSQEVTDNQKRFLKKALEIIENPNASKEFSKKCDEIYSHSKGHFLKALEINNVQYRFNCIKYIVMNVINWALFVIILSRPITYFWKPYSWILQYNSIINKSIYISLLSLLIVSYYYLHIIKGDIK